MEEIKTIKTDNKQEEKKPLVEQMKELSNFKNEVLSGEIKIKKLKLPRKARVKKRSLKKGHIGILRIDENRNITAEKQRISGSSFKSKDGYYHATDGREIFFWEGKFPVIIQPSWKNNPLQIIPEQEKNETYGQPYIKAKLLRDVIKVKSTGGGMIIWILLGVAALVGVNYLMGGNMFG